MNNYDHTARTDRQALAAAMIAKLTAAGFKQVTPEHRTTELAFGYRASDVVGIKVLTSIETVNGVPEVRRVGADAIRVVAVNVQTGRGYIGGITRVNRAGKKSAIVDRMMSRARAAWLQARDRARAA